MWGWWERQELGEREDTYIHTHIHTHTHTYPHTPTQVSLTLEVEHCFQRFGSALHGNDNKEATKVAGTERDCWGRTMLVLTKCYTTCLFEHEGRRRYFCFPEDIHSGWGRFWVHSGHLSKSFSSPQASFDTHTFFFLFLFILFRVNQQKKYPEK